MLELLQVLQATPLPSYATLMGILIVISLYLHKWYPPIKPQYIATIMLAAGVVAGHFLVANPCFGFIFAGVVYYKDEFARDAQLVVKSYKGAFATTDDKSSK